MKIFGICLVKNEVDIISYSLKEASKWADKIFVYDNGSTDGTWELVQEIAKSNQVIVPWKSEAKPFRDGLRAEVFNEFKHFARQGDWWCVRLDSDEFYIDNPKEFLPKVGKLHHAVTSHHYEYRLTYEDLDEFDFNDTTESNLEKIKYYNKKITCETRFVRHRMRLTWPESYSYPKHKGLIWKDSIRIKHFQYRSPEQIERRIKVRIQATKEGYMSFKRDNVSSWKEKLESRENLIKEDPSFPIGWVQDTNRISFFRYAALYILHALRIFP